MPMPVKETGDEHHIILIMKQLFINVLLKFKQFHIVNHSEEGVGCWHHNE